MCACVYVGLQNESQKSHEMSEKIQPFGVVHWDKKSGLQLLKSCSEIARVTRRRLRHVSDGLRALVCFGAFLAQYGWSCDFVDIGDVVAVKKALAQPRVKALFVESLANPGGVIADLEALAEAAHAVEVRV